MKKEIKIIKKAKTLFDKYQHLITNEFLLAIVFFILIVFLIVPKSKLGISSLKIGDVAPKTIRSNVSMLVEDPYATHAKIKQAEEAVPNVFYYNPELYDNLYNKIYTAFNDIANIKDKTLALKKFNQDLDINLDLDTFNKILKNKSIILRFTNTILKDINRYYVLSGPSDYQYVKNQILIYNTELRTSRLETNTEKFIDLNTAKALSYDKLHWSVPNSDLRKLIIDFVFSLVKPNAFYNSEKTQELKKQAREKIAPVYLKLSKGEVVVREGDIIDKNAYVKLKALNSLFEVKNRFLDLIGIILILAVFFVTSAFVYKKLRPTEKIPYKKLIVITGTIVLLQIILIKVFYFLSVVVGYYSPDFPKSVLLYLVPFAVASILGVLLVGFKYSISISLITVILASITVDNSLRFMVFIYSFLDSAVASVYLVGNRNRGGIVKVGFIISLINVVLILIFYMLQSNNLFNTVTLISIGLGALNGILTAIIISGILPIFEWLFDIATNVKLVELGNLNHPLLKELAIKAPGTYHHSIVVSSLSEAACQAIGANSLLAKVGSYYHDIGKVRKPTYFIENQFDIENPHDRLMPYVSSLIIKNHVKDGVEIGKKYRLGSQIIDIIEQHHGTMIVKYFYDKAKEMGLNPNEEDFRYPGPKPQSKESGIVMLADKVEAATKNLNEPTVTHLKNYVKNLTNEIFLDGQLDESDLSLRELNLIVDSFVNVLIGIFHHRIKYK
ncbi:MAG: HD family phosphohydrolase [Desulfurella sp.]|uniref:HD family phosphohydrolase n=1 Tax=Desulfurella sp. TaxID=1962857 RepID=UPI003D0F721F